MMDVVTETVCQQCSTGRSLTFFYRRGIISQWCLNVTQYTSLAVGLNQQKEGWIMNETVIINVTCSGYKTRNKSHATFNWFQGLVQINSAWNLWSDNHLD